MKADSVLSRLFSYYYTTICSGDYVSFSYSLHIKSIYSFSRGMYLINNNVLVVEFSNKIFIFATQI